MIRPTLKLIERLFLFSNSEDGHGQVKRINFSEPHRDSTFPVSIDDVHIWYDAIEQFVKIAYDENIISTFKMKPGTCSENNFRIAFVRVRLFRLINKSVYE